MDGYITAITGTVGNTLSFSNSNTNSTAGLLEIIGDISTMPGPLISFGDTQVTFGHMITGGIILLLVLFARLLDQKFNLDQEYQDSENQEQE